MHDPGLAQRLRSKAAPRWPLRAVFGAAFLTLATYLLLPCMEMLSGSPDRDLTVRAFDTAELPPAPAPMPREEPVREAQPAESPLPKPRLASPRATRLPVSLAMNLDLTLGASAGDFDMNFGIRAPAALVNQDDGIFELFELDEAPRAMVRIEPLYPVQARMRQIEGSVVLEFVVDAQGKPRDIRVISATPGRLFADAAVQAVSRWRFTPGRRNGKPVPVRVRQKISFKLDDRQ